MVWHKVADNAAMLPWQENGMCIVTAGAKQVTLARQADSIFAFALKCPHASGIMADGYITAAGQVACPLHRYRFNMKNGRNTTGEGYFLKTYAVKIEETGIWVGWEDKGLLGIW